MSESPACTCEYEPDDYQPDIAGPDLYAHRSRTDRACPVHGDEHPKRLSGHINDAYSGDM